jgi:fluoroquinolone transport system permease protein
MQVTSVFRRLGRNDTRLIGRDSFMVMVIGYILIMAAILRFAVPWVTGRALAELHLDLRPYYPLIASYLALALSPQIAGYLFGFLLLDERDGHTLKAMLVTPLPLDTFILYRILVASLLAFVLAMATLWIMNLMAFSLGEILLVAAVAGLFAPVIMMYLSTFAANKVEGFALIKILSVVSLIPAAAWFLPMPWQLLAGLYPPYWVSKAMWVVAEGGGSWPVYLAVGALATMIVVRWFVRRFRAVAYR